MTGAGYKGLRRRRPEVENAQLAPSPPSPSFPWHYGKEGEGGEGASWAFSTSDRRRRRPLYPAPIIDRPILPAMIAFRFRYIFFLGNTALRTGP